MDGMGRFALAHNGIVENYHELKETLLADGVSFTSETDTEVIVQLRPSSTTGYPQSAYGFTGTP